MSWVSILVNFVAFNFALLYTLGERYGAMFALPTTLAMLGDQSGRTALNSKTRLLTGKRLSRMLLISMGIDPKGVICHGFSITRFFYFYILIQWKMGIFFSYFPVTETNSIFIRDCHEFLVSNDYKMYLHIRSIYICSTPKIVNITHRRLFWWKKLKTPKKNNLKTVG